MVMYPEMEQQLLWQSVSYRVLEAGGPPWEAPDTLARPAPHWAFGHVSSVTLES